MRILFVTQAEKTHMLSMVPLAWALRSAGHEVRVASQPDLREAVVETGLPFCAVGPPYALEQYLRAFKALESQHVDGEAGAGLGVTVDLDGMDTDELLELYGGVVNYWLRMVNDLMLDDLVALCRQWGPDLVIWEPKTYAGGIAAEAAGASHARFLWGMDVLTQMRIEIEDRTPDPEQAWERDNLARWLAGRAARYGVEFGESLVHGQVTLDPFPEEVQLELGTRTSRRPIRYVPFNGAARVPAWLRSRPDHPRVCVTMGSSSMERFDGNHHLGDFLAALAELDVEIIATLPDEQSGELRTLPDNVRIFSHVPMQPLLETCDAVVHHGGAGTCLTAMSLGVPQLIISDLVMPKYQFDERVLAGRLAAQGASIELSGEDVTPARTREALRSLLAGSGFRRGAGLLRERMLGTPTPAEFARRVEELVMGGVRPDDPVPTA